MQYHYAIEVEATNYCNANCVFCANKAITRPRGFLQPGNFRKFIAEQEALLEQNIFRLHGISSFPRVTFCGLGDPLLHPQISELIKIAGDAGFFTQLVTNGALLTEDKAWELCDSGLNQLCVSLHSVNQTHYKEITALELSQTIHALRQSLPVFQQQGVQLEFWRIHHPLDAFRDTAKDEEDYRRFLKEVGAEKVTVLGPSEPWSRNGVVPNSRCSSVRDEPLWCNKILFTWNLDWQGNVVLCCNDYNYEKNVIGNVFDSAFDYNKMFYQKMRVLRREVIPEMCVHCRRWPDTELGSILRTNSVDETKFVNIVNQDLQIGESSNE